MDGDQVFVEQADLFEKCDGPFSITLNDLICFTVALLRVQVELRLSLFDYFLRLKQHFRADEVRSLRPEQNLYVVFIVPLIVHADILAQSFFAHGIVKLVELARIVDASLRSAEHQRQIPAGADFLDEFSHAVNFVVLIAQCRRSRFDCFDNRYAASLYRIVQRCSVRKRLKPVHHPVVRVLRKTPQDVVQRMHVTVDKAGEHCVMFEI